MKYTMTIVLQSDMCMGNGEGRGNSVDRDICTDKKGLPYIPARRIKGCLRQTANLLKENNYSSATEDNIAKLFGNPFGDEGAMIFNDAYLPNYKGIVKAIDEIEKNKKAYLYDVIHPENIEKCFTAVRGQTSLKDGVKVDNTLRFTRVLTKNNQLFNTSEPVKFVAELYLENENEGLEELLIACCKGTRHIGTSRNRGLGNITISLVKNQDYENACRKVEIASNIDDNAVYSLNYLIHLDSAVSVPDCGVDKTIIPAKSIIGCLGGYYYKKYPHRENEFQDLFLNGNTVWSAITPVIEGRNSVPVPMNILKLKNDNNKLINQFSQKDDNWKKLKPKTVEDSYAVEVDDGFVIADVTTRAQYHNNISQKMLYTQDSIEDGYIYGGTVTFSGRYYSDIVDMLSNANLRFGRSKNTQYSNCHLISVDMPAKKDVVTDTIEGRVFVILQSDMIVRSNGVNIAESQLIREQIWNEMGFKGVLKESTTDKVKYGTIGGFHNMWNLQKMRSVVVKAGSLFCFDIEPSNVAVIKQVGDNIQEGYGVVKVYSEAAMAKLTSITKGEIDKEKVVVGQEEIAPIEKQLTILAIREALLRYARTYTVSYKYRDKVPVSRLRLMLQNSKDFLEFCEKVDSIKLSDVSSETKGRKDAALSLVRDFYCNGDIVNVIAWNKLLADYEGLYECVNNDAELKQSVESMWKVPLMEKLHEMHYRKGAK